MEPFFLIAYGALIAVGLLQAILLILQTVEHCRYGRSCMRIAPRRRATGRVAVFAPCKGLDVDLEGNLRAVLEQDYQDFEVTFVVESDDDPACTVIRRLIAEYPGVATRLVVAGVSVDSGQKVHNLRAATATLGPEIRYLAFIDSDSRPRPEWLRMLICRFANSRLGAVTGYRWFVPERATLANLVLYSLNCEVMALLGRSSHYLVWGGSWAIRRDVFERTGLRDAWKGTLSDDLVASQVLRKARLPVRFEPACVVASPVNADWKTMLSFVRRQYLVGRNYTPHWWVFALLGSTLVNLLWLVQVVALVGAAITGAWPVAVPAAAIGLLYASHVVRGAMRQRLVDVYFPGGAHQPSRSTLLMDGRATSGEGFALAHSERAAADRGPIPSERRTLAMPASIDAARRFDVWLNPLGMVANWVGVVASMFGRHITWRQIRYRMGPDGKIQSRECLAEPVGPTTLPFPGPSEIPSADSPETEPLEPLRKAG